MRSQTTCLVATHILPQKVCREAHDSAFRTGSWVMADAAILYVTFHEWRGPGPQSYQTTHRSPHSLLTFTSLFPWPHTPFPVFSSRNILPHLQSPAHVCASRTLVQEPWAEVIILQSLPPSPITFPLSHTAPATQASLQFPKHAPPAPASGPLHKLFLLPKMPFPQISSYPTRSPPSSLHSNVSFMRFIF